MQKKGAIELSMTTIIVIVIGVTLLSLGLVWVRTTFKNITSLTEDQFAKAKEIIDTTPVTEEKLTVPLQIDINDGETKGFKIYLNNDGSIDTDRFEVRIDGNAPNGVSVGLVGSEVGESKTYKIEEGSTKEIRALIIIKKGVKSATPTFNVVVNNGEYEEKGFIVVIGKS